MARYFFQYKVNNEIESKGVKHLIKGSWNELSELNLGKKYISVRVE